MTFLTGLIPLRLGMSPWQGALKHVENLLIDNTELGHEDPEEGEQ
jgi:hypothetical protein